VGPVRDPQRPERTLTADQLDEPTPAPELIEHALHQVRLILRATDWSATWLRTRPGLGVDRERQLVLILPVVDSGHGAGLAVDGVLSWPIDGFPQSEAEAAQAVRRTLTEWWDHELREQLRGPSGHAFAPHGDGRASTGDTRFHVDGR
jgi:hypothetical protein